MEETMRAMILLQDNIELWKQDVEHRKRKAEIIEFNKLHAEFIARGINLDDDSREKDIDDGDMLDASYDNL